MAITRERRDKVVTAIALTRINTRRRGETNFNAGHFLRTMPRYFFHLYNDDVTHDDEGVQCSDDAAAIVRAEEEVAIQAAESVRRHHHLVRSHRIVVVNEAGDAVATVTFGDVVAVQG